MVREKQVEGQDQKIENNRGSYGFFFKTRESNKFRDKVIKY